MEHPHSYIENAGNFARFSSPESHGKLTAPHLGRLGVKIEDKALGEPQINMGFTIQWSNDPMIQFQWYRIWTQKFVEEKTFEINMYKDWNFSNFSNKAVVLFTSQKEELCISWVPQYTHYNDLPICGSTTLQFLTYAHAHKQYMDKVWLQHLQSCVPFTTQYLIQFWLVVQ